MPEPNVEVTEAQGSGFGGFGGYGGYGSSRFDAIPRTNQLHHPRLAARARQQKREEGREQRRLRRTGADYDTGGDHAFPLPRAGEGRSSNARSGGGSRNPSASDDDTSSPSPWRARDERVPRPRLPLTIEGELVAKSTGTVSSFTLGDRVFHQKFGNGNVTAIDGNKLTIQFDRAGEKRVVDSFVERV